MASGIRVVMQGRGIAEILKDDGVRAELTRKAEAVLSAARASAPVASGEYAGSLHIKQDTTDRAAVRVGSDVPHALVVEANTGNLARALDAR